MEGGSGGQEGDANSVAEAAEGIGRVTYTHTHTLSRILLDRQGIRGTKEKKNSAAIVNYICKIPDINKMYL